MKYLFAQTGLIKCALTVIFRDKVSVTQFHSITGRYLLMKPGFWMFLILVFVAQLGHAASIAAGNQVQNVTLDDKEFKVYTYRPVDCSPKAFLMVFHGTNRNADTYRDVARPLADKLCLIVVAPRFTKWDFPPSHYQYGGMTNWHGGVLPIEEWSGQYAMKLVAWVRRTEGNSDMPYYFIGHSAGAQFLSRLAVIPNQAQRIVVVNPSTWVLPTTKVDAPFGLGGIPDAENVLKRYLAEPIVVMLGQEDEGSFELDVSPRAMDQGANRHERGERAFAMAQAEAKAHGWPCNWKLIEVPGVGHSAGKMFSSTQAVDALNLALPVEGHP
jgi:dienelactone hydrolase